MPNWCWNSMEVDLEKYGDLILKENEKGEKEVDFNIVLPMPESLNIISGSDNDTDMYIYLSEKLSLSKEKVKANPDSKLISNMFSKHDKWLKEIRIRCADKPAEEMDAAYMRGYILVDNYHKYGATTWYDWCCGNWGVKWNASDTDAGDNYVNFTTPWGPPDGWINTLKDRGVPFQLDWEEEGGNSGSYICDGQTIEEADYPYDIDWLKEAGFSDEVINDLRESGYARDFDSDRGSDCDEYKIFTKNELVKYLKSFDEFEDCAEDDDYIDTRRDLWYDGDAGPIAELSNGTYLVALMEEE